MERRGRRLGAAAPLLALLLAACDAGASAPATTEEQPERGPQAQRVIAELEEELGVAFEPAGPHHDLGRGPNGVEIDLIGVPVEEVVLSVPAEDARAGQTYLPYLRDLLHGPPQVYEWISAGLACRDVAASPCEEGYAQGNLAARFSDGGDDYVVVSLSRDP